MLGSFGGDISMLDVPSLPTDNKTSTSNKWTTVSKNKKGSLHEKGESSEAHSEPILDVQQEVIQNAENHLTHEQRKLIDCHNQIVRHPHIEPSASLSDKNHNTPSPEAGPSHEKGKGPDPCNWGGIDLNDSELNIENQAKKNKTSKKATWNEPRQHHGSWVWVLSARAPVITECGYEVRQQLIPRKWNKKNPQDDGDHDSANDSNMNRAPPPQKKGKGFTLRGSGTATMTATCSIQPANKKGKGLVPFVQKDRVWTAQETMSNLQSANKCSGTVSTSWNVIELLDDSEAEGNNVVEETAEDELDCLM
ncbi:hypothetical protein BDQ17DRAFT_1332856 [Cyathus striatus]|nr:hypothetical protein BDQ17DRAFT_1332856 [Cyathus striatus]